MSESGLTVGENPWLLCALWWTLRVHLLGLAWSWVAAVRWRGMGWLPAVLAPWFGVVLHLVAVVSLAECGLYTPVAEAVVLAVLAATGLAWGRGRIRIRPHLPVALATGIAAAAAMLLPGRGEWIAGGLDQGIYVNQGVAVSRSGTFHPPPDPLLSVLTDQELAIFTRQVHNYTEYLPTIPVDPERRTLVHFFFRGTPAMVAVADRCGGLRAATRINLLLGWPVLLTIGALTAVLYRRWAPILAGTLILAMNPVFVFLLHLPTSEMLQTLLVGGTLVLLAASPPTGLAVHAAATGLLAAMLNRFSFFPFGALLLVAWVWRHGRHPGRRGLPAGAAALAGGLLLGLGFDLWRCPIPVGRLDELVAPMLGAGGVLAATALAAAAFPILRRPAMHIPPWALPVGLLATVLATLLVQPFADGAVASHVDLARNLRGVLPYFSIGALALAMLGWGAACRPHAALPRRTAMVLGFLGAGALLSLTVAAISRLYPWALRRQMIYTVPFLVLLCAHAAHWLWRRLPHPTLSRAALAVLLATALLGSARLSRQAATATDYNGLSRIVADIAAHLPPDAVVVADHFVWSTPLRMLHNVPVLNGEVLWASFNPDRMAAALDTLARLEAAGWDVFFLTSTAEGLNPYQGAITPTPRLDWESGPIPIADLHDHPSQREFLLHTRIKEFRLYDWP